MLVMTVISQLQRHLQQLSLTSTNSNDPRVLAADDWSEGDDVGVERVHGEVELIRINAS